MGFRVTVHRSVAFAAALLVLVGVLIGVSSDRAKASYLEQGVVVGDDPVNHTPNILDGRVHAITTVGDRVIVGGTFSEVKNAGDSTVISRDYILAFDKDTGVVDTSFVPTLNGAVETVAPAPDGTSVFVGGSFSTVNGVSNFGITKLDVATGQMVSGFDASTAGKVRDIEVSGNTVYLGGDIWSVNGVPRSRLAAIDATTGAVDTTFTVGTTAPRVTVDWVAELAVHPDGSEMTIIGNFLEVDNIERAQVAVIDLTGPTAQVADWDTQRFAASCSSSFWTYTRDVEYAPSGDYFAIVTTGGPRYPDFCDTATRWETGVRGSDLLETWVDWSGGDTLTAVAVSDVAVYVGGHQRWMNNHAGSDFAGDGAVVREGIVALDPINGVPYSWNPGKDRGVAVWDLHLSNLGLYVGSDTDFTAGEYHAKLAQFPLTGGTTPPVPTPAVLPVDLFAGEGNTLTSEVFTGTSVGTPTDVPGNVLDWDDVNGAFHQAGRLYWTETDGQLRSRPFDGVTMGTSRDEPSWVDWSGITSATWWEGRMYYTVSGDDELYFRTFSLESGISGSLRYTVSGNGDGLDWSATRGLVAAEGKLYYTTSGGDFYSIDLNGRNPVPGTESLISGPSAGDGRNWAGADIFLLEVDSPPTVTITSPTDGEAIAGSVDLTATASDDLGVQSVEFSVDGSVVGTDTDGSDGWSVTWDSTAVADGPIEVSAVASDQGGQTATDAVSATVDNLGPVTDLTTPVDGATVSGNVSVTATVTDDVGVAQAEFFAGGASIGVDTDGSDGWGVSWDSTTIADGATTVDVVGTDTFGRTSSDSANVTVDNEASGIVAMVVADPASLSSGDTEVSTRLENLGYAVALIDDNDVSLAAVEGASVVLVTSSANSFRVGTKLVDATQPVWVAKPWLLDDMGLTGTTAGTDFGTVSASTVTIDDPGHPLAGGYSGDVVVTSGNVTNSFGIPGPGAEQVSTASGKPATFVYQSGATLANGSTATGCRIHHSLFGSAPLSFTADGWSLFETVVAYGANNCSAPPVDEPPVATITAPEDGTTVQGTVTITATATDDDAVTQVEFLVDGTSVGVDTDGGDGWSIDWDSTTSGDGSVSVTATATDTADQTGSDSVNVTVDNVGPQITITDPSDGATVSDSVTITADVGSDPTVTQVEFFIDGTSLGVDTDGADGWSQLWDTTGTADGSVEVSATATDTSLRTASDLVTVTVDNSAAGFITMVVGNAATLSTSDTALRDRFVAGGYVVTLVDDNDATAADADGASFVYVSSSINSGVLGNTFAQVTQPVWVAKPWSLDDMGMTGTTSGTDFGMTKANTLTILDDTHPLAAGYSGDVVVSNSNRSMSWGLPAASAALVAEGNGFTTSFVYAQGALLADDTSAAGCRLHVSAFQTAVLDWTTDGWAMFDAAATYAANGCS